MTKYLTIVLTIFLMSACGPQIIDPHLPTELVGVERWYFTSPTPEPTATTDWSGTDHAVDCCPEPTRAPAATELPYYIRVDIAGLNLRTGPGKEYNKITTLVSGDIAVILDKKNGWTKVHYIDLMGWIKNGDPWQDYIIFLDEEPIVNFTQKMAREEFGQYFDHTIKCANKNPYDGYIHQDACIPAIIDAAAWSMQYPATTVGRAGRYYEGIMEIVLENRGLSVKGYVGAVALESCAHIGQSVWIQLGGVLEGPYLVADCGGRYGLFRNLAVIGFIVELGFNSFQRAYAAGEWSGQATVCFSNPCEGPAIDFKNYWLERITYENPDT